MPQDFKPTCMICIPKSNIVQHCEEFRTREFCIMCCKNTTKNYIYMYYCMGQKRFYKKISLDFKEILSLWLIMKKSLRLNKEIITFFDMKKLFCQCGLEYNVQSAQGCKDRLSYQKNNSTVHRNLFAIGQDGQQPKISKCVRQGCGLFLLLFNLHIENTMKEFSEIRGIG